MTTMFTIISSWLTPTVFFCLMNLVIATIFLSYKKPAPDPDPAHPLARAPSLLERVRSINFSPYNSDPTRNPTQSPSLIERARSIKFSLYNQDPVQDPTQELNHYNTESPSLLQRVRSIKLNNYNAEPTQDPAQSLSLLQRVRSIKLNNYNSDSTQDPTQSPSLLQRVCSIKLNNYYNSDSTQDPAESPSLLQRVRSIKSNYYNTDPIHDQHEPRPTHGSHHRSGSEPGGPKARRPDPSFEDAVAAPARMRKSSSVRTMKPAAEAVEERRPATTRERGDEEVDERADDFINKFKNQLKLQRLDSILRYKEMLNRGASR